MGRLGRHPTLTSLSPSYGAATATATVVVTGTNLGNLRSVTLGSTSLSYPPLTSNTVRVFVKPRSAGAAGLRIVTAGGTSNALTLTAVAPVRPVITALNPAVGPVTAATPGTVTGVGFTGATRLSPGGRAMSFTRVSSTELRFTAPPRPGPARRPARCRSSSSGPAAPARPGPSPTSRPCRLCRPR